MPFEPVIGLEIHTQLATQSKIFCSCPTTFGEQPNANTCPVCLGLPGVLPVLNEQVVEFAIRLGLATNCTIRKDSQFSRKNYLYPDLPKAYQISQYDRPICENGWVEIDVDGVTKKIGITRIHMEEDAGKLVHSGQQSYVDLNRAGVPLLEIVSEPELTSPADAKAYMEALHAIVTTVGVSDGNLEKGNFRCDVNISLKPVGQKEFGTRTETKNINSFKFVQQALEYEIERQEDILSDGGTITQETRLWDAEKKRSYSMRSKEDAHDYRYFPEPDLPVVLIAQETIDAVAAQLPELPRAKQTRFMEQYELSHYDASTLVSQKEWSDYFESLVSKSIQAKLACNWILTEMVRVSNETQESISEIMGTERLVPLLAMLQEQTISHKIAKTVFQEMRDTEKSAEVIIEEKGLKQVSDTSSLEPILQKIVSDHPEQAEQYRSGKTKVFGFFVGQAMKATKGQANPKVVNELLKTLLERS